MRKKIYSGIVNKPRWVTDVYGADYTGMGLTTFKKWAAQIGAKRKIGRKSLYDMHVIDAAMDEAQVVEISQEGAEG